MRFLKGKTWQFLKFFFFFFRQLVVFLQRKKIFPEDANYEIFLNDFDNKNMTNP